MKIPNQVQVYSFSSQSIDVYVPAAMWAKGLYTKKMTDTGQTVLPYWAQIWPAAKALCEVLASEPALVKNKVVLEIAAGLGLPSLFAAKFAKQVIATDYIKDAVELMKHSASCNHLQNIQCQVMDWNKPDKKIKPEVVLLSDVNYEPASFDALYALLAAYLRDGATILLSTPQRLIAKSFMGRLQPWCIKTYNIDIPHKNETVFTSVWVLKDSNKQ